MLNNEGLTGILHVKKFAGTGIRTHDLPRPSGSSSQPHPPYRLRPLLACMFGLLLVVNTLGDLAVAALAIVSVTSYRTQSLYIQRSSCPSA